MHSSGVTLSTDNFVHYNEILKVQDSIMDDVKVPKESKELVEKRRELLRKNFCISEDEIKYSKIDLNKLIKEKNIDDEVLLSIVIPVYNVEKYLKKCLKSVFLDLPIKTEVIVINDGSPDNSEAIIKEFEKEHKELRYIKKENGGLSSVKNVGLKKAKGKYIIFIDSDDYVSSNMYNTMLKMIISEDADLVYSDVLMVYEDNSVRYVSMKNYDRKDDLMQVLDGNLMAASWNKMVKRELYYGLSFPEGINNEDVAVTPLIFLRCKKMCHIPSPFYKYYQRSGSIQNSGFSEKRFMIFDTSKICFDAIKNYDYMTQEKVIGSIVTHQLIALLVYVICSIKNKEDRDKYILEFCKRFNDLGLDLDNNQYVCEYLHNLKIDNILRYIKSNDVNKIYSISKVIR